MEWAKHSKYAAKFDFDLILILMWSSVSGHITLL